MSDLHRNSQQANMKTDPSCEDPQWVLGTLEVNRKPRMPGVCRWTMVALALNAVAYVLMVIISKIQGSAHINDLHPESTVVALGFVIPTLLTYAGLAHARKMQPMTGGATPSRLDIGCFTLTMMLLNLPILVLNYLTYYMGILDSPFK